MIAKKTAIKRARGASALAKYIAAAKEKGEKLDAFWMTNCNAGEGLEDLDVGIKEIEATQSLNSRSKADPNYHLIVSFAEGEKPDLETLKAIETEFAKALGFEEHQRVVGTHINTDNFHMHIMFNKVHPETYRMHTPFRDFKILQETAAELEQKFGLTVVQGRGQDTDQNKTKEQGNRKARDMEANRWELSFSGYLQMHKDGIVSVREHAGSWQVFHDGLDAFGIAVRKRGAGLVFMDLQSHKSERCSRVDRSLSLKKLEEKFGPFVARDRERPKTRNMDRYSRRPLDPRLAKHPAWKQFLQNGKRGMSWKRWLETQAGVNAEVREALELQATYLKIVAGQEPGRVRSRQIGAKKVKGLSR